MRNELKKQKLLSVALVSMLALGTSGAAFAQGATAPSVFEEGVVASGDTATFAGVQAAQKGYLVIHEVDDQNVAITGAHIGYAPLMAGPNSDIQVMLQKPLVPGQSYVAQIYTETNDNEVFEGNMGQAEVDSPARDEGDPIFMTFTAQ
ncbi:DUF7282 domain-containing protein [Oceaniglobus indicus]|uniref:DUF7282 domain-containing protein n=1 Tax=Oceaniglobus indicus TaxID=2047749 RepID=UPI000C1931BA|nr:hypothetical protein [Oceaniglobus indicus]